MSVKDSKLEVNVLDQQQFNSNLKNKNQRIRE